MRASELKHSVSIQTRASATPDAFGETPRTWRTLYTTYAKIEPQYAREYMSRSSVLAEATHRITVRWRDELANPIEVQKMRVLFGARIFNIVAAINLDEANHWVELLCTEGTNDGG